MALALALGVGVLVLAVAEPAGRAGPRQLRAEVGAGFDGLWAELEAAAAAAADRVRLGGSASDLRLAAFGELSALVESYSGRVSFLLLDPDGVDVAWAGEGLLHEIGGPESPTGGRHFRAGFDSVTPFVVRALEEAPRPWRVVAGRSLAAARLPFGAPDLGPVRWTLVGEDEPMSGALETFGSRHPLAALRGSDLDGALSRAGSEAGYRRLAGASVGLALLIAIVGSLLGSPPERPGASAERQLPKGALRLTLAAVAVLGWTAGLTPRALLLLVSAVAFAALAWRRRARTPGPAGATIVGAAACPVVALAAWGLQHDRAPVDLGGHLPPGAEATALGLATFALALGVLGLSGRARSGSSGGRRWAWLSLGVLLAAAAMTDRAAPVALALLALAGVWTARWLRALRASPRLAEVGALLLLAALLSATGWEVVYRARLKSYLEAELLAQTAPPTPRESEEMARRLWRFFRRLDLDRVALKDPELLDHQDLALAVWKASPLPRRGALSAVRIESWRGQRSSFSFGLPLTDEDRLDRSADRAQTLEPAVLDRSLVEGAEALEYRGRAWGFIRYWMVVSPGYRISRDPLDDLEAGLLRGGPDPLQAAAAVFAPARLAFYPPGSARPREPLEEGPRLDELAIGGRARVRLGDAPALAMVAAEDETARALILPLLGPAAAIERVAVHAFGVLLPGAGLAALALLLSLRRAVKAVRQATRFYSKRLLLVYAAFILVPVLVLNVFLLRVLGEHFVDEQRAAGRRALESAQRILGEYVLTLDPGFGIETELNDELMVWLSRVVRHEVNLYWGSSVYASSRRELFTAGLLPQRIPGEIYSRLALGDAGLATRTHRAGATDYLELYVPLAIPGVPLEQVRLVLSMPLLAQEEELAEQLSALRQRTLLATLALALLLAAVGSQLARSFTSPLMEVVEGTQRIAAGARSMGVQPSELELAALVEAIDRMAERIASSRQALVREKSLVDRMIDNINSGVVSVDAGGRVLMANRVAKGLLGVEVGESLGETVARSGRLAPVEAFLAGVAEESRARTVRLSDADADADEREWTLVWVPLPGGGEPSALLVVEDVTEVLQGQRLQAWAEMARIIAHEIKNPLTPIRLSAEHMREVRARDPQQFDRVFERCTRNILDQVGELQEISSEFLAYSRIPRSKPRRGDLTELVTRVVEAYRAAPPKGVEVALEPDGSPIEADFDAKLLGRALRNLIENAVRATAGGGRVTVALERDGKRARIAVADDGPGVPAAQLSRIFDPYFSTHDTGTGLGLPIARRIAEEHGGSVRAVNRPGGGLTVTISIPAA